MKCKLPFKITLRLAMQGKTVTKIMTVFLCAFSFALFALASTGFAYNESNFLTEAYLNLLNSQFHAIVFEYKNPQEASLGYTNASFRLGQEKIELVERETGLEYAYVYFDAGGSSDFSVYLQHYMYDAYDKGGRPNYIQNGPSGQPTVVCAEEALLNGLGFSLVAGSYPKNIYEISISLSQYERFQKCGFSDNTANYVYFKNGCFSDGAPYYDPETGEAAFLKYNGDPIELPSKDYTGWFFCERPNCGEREQIGAYDDIIGKNILLNGDPDTGVLDRQNMYSVKIVGVVDDSNAHYLPGLGGDASFVSPEWRSIFLEGHDEYCTNMAAPPMQDESVARKCVGLTQEWIKEYDEMYGKKGQVGAYPLSKLINNATPIDSDFYTSEKVVIAIGSAAGLLFGLFSVLLCVHLFDSALQLKRIKIGILRSLGANEADLKRIFYVEVLLIALCSFLLALGLSALAYYGLLQPWTFRADFGVSLLQFTGWTVLILAGLSFGVPLLCSIVLLRKFLKKSIVDNISGNIKAR